MVMNLRDLVFGAIAIVLLGIFLGIMIWWVKAPPLIAIVVFVMILIVYDWVQTVRFGENYSQRK
jgi:xanthosine utilization system XapX-like protein